ncbi:MAG TPA: GNAT family N-acetyltransferase [Verrucomicrobiae bacterium]|nr:GNAT family N-acetyltransferase [Verrucomicrobiae bacterium]
MNFIIRKARPDDAEQLLRHIHRLLREPGIPIPLDPGEFVLSVEQQRGILANASNSASSVYFVAEAGNQIIGEINCKCGTRRAFNHIATLGMSVNAEWRNKGVGNRLMAEAIAWSKSTRAVGRIELFVYADNSSAIHLYEKFGFEIEGRRRQAVFQNGSWRDDLIMARLM